MAEKGGGVQQVEVCDSLQVCWVSLPGGVSPPGGVFLLLRLLEEKLPASFDLKHPGRKGTACI